MKKIIFPILLSIFACSQQKESNPKTQDTVQLGPSIEIERIREAPPIEQSPDFPGGLDSMISFIKRHGRPKGVTDCVGTVYVSFIVNENGTLTDFEVIKGICKEFDDYTIEYMKTSPNWINKTGSRKRIVWPFKYSHQVLMHIP